MKEKILMNLLAIMLCASTVSVEANTGEFFASLPDSFSFSSGAGAWGTILDLNDDGSFTGQFHDSNMGETGEDYPNGTVYISDFAGKFSEPERINDYTYSMNLEYLETERPVGEEFYENDVKYISSDPYGFDNAEAFYIYLPGAPVSDIPEEFMLWSHLSLDTITHLPEDFYGIYNVNGELGFVGYLNNTDVLYELEMEDTRINEALYNAMTQAEINAYSAELYTLWDDELNAIWKELKNMLDEQTMTQLTNEQVQWIYDKENAAELEAAPYEGGSLYSAVYNEVVYRWTKERVYYLIEKFPDIRQE